MRHGGVHIIGDEPVEALVGEEANLLPVFSVNVIAACIEVTQEQDILQVRSIKVM